MDCKQYTTLLETLCDLPDPQNARDKRYPLAVIAYRDYGWLGERPAERSCHRSMDPPSC